MVHGYYEARDPAATTELPPRPEGGADFGNYTQHNFNSSANRGVTLSRFFALHCIAIVNCQLPTLFTFVAHHTKRDSKMPDYCESVTSPEAAHPWSGLCRTATARVGGTATCGGWRS